MTVNQINDPQGGVNQVADEKAFADKLLQTFDLPTSLQHAIEESEKEGEKEQEPAKEVERVDEAEVEQEEQAQEEKKTEDGEEDLIPKSTFQKRLDEMTREKRQLEARLRRLEEERESSSNVKDGDTVKLEGMSESELQSLKRQTRLAQIQNSSDANMVNKLLELEDKIDSVMRTAPQRLNERQIQRFNEAVVASASEIQNFEKARADVFGLAKRIYDNTPELHRVESGQARAWNLAVEHYKIMQEARVGKTKAEELGRQVNTLKKKVSLDGERRKVSKEPDDDEKLFSRAKNGEYRDKLEFIRRTMKTDETVDGFLGRNQ